MCNSRLHIDLSKDILVFGGLEDWGVFIAVESAQLFLFLFVYFMFMVTLVLSCITCYCGSHCRHG